MKQIEKSVWQVIYVFTDQHRPQQIKNTCLNYWEAWSWLKMYEKQEGTTECAYNPCVSTKDGLHIVLVECKLSTYPHVGNWQYDAEQKKQIGISVENVQSDEEIALERGRKYFEQLRK